MDDTSASKRADNAAQPSLRCCTAILKINGSRLVKDVEWTQKLADESSGSPEKWDGRKCVRGRALGEDGGIVVNVVVLVAAVALIVLVFHWSGKYGDRGRRGGVSLRRGANAHTTMKGQPKKGYVTRSEAAARAGVLARRDGAPMSVYRCATCAQWHVGHES